MQVKTAGLVLREVRVGETDKLLTVLTPDLGQISCKARGALRKNSRLGSACQLFAFSEFTLFCAKSNYRVDEASPVELFCPLREQVESLALAAYVSEVLGLLSQTDSGTDMLLRLGLNTLYALSEQTAPQARIKAAFELRAAALSGYEPEVEGGRCCVCGGERELWFCPEAGGIYCRGHVPAAAVPLCAGAERAMEYIVGCDLKKLFSFTLPEEGMRALAAACEKYLLACVGRGFRTLDYYKKLQ